MILIIVWLFFLRDLLLLFGISVVTEVVRRVLLPALDSRSLCSPAFAGGLLFPKD